MSLNAIRLDPETRLYHFDSAVVSAETLIRLRDEALAAPRRKVTVYSFSGNRHRRFLPNMVEVGSVCVTPNYITLMLRFVEKHGWFIDWLIVHQDHRFDPNSPTPGSRWGEVRELRRQAKALERAAEHILRGRCR